jgi:hypothetical protein
MKNGTWRTLKRRMPHLFHSFIVERAGTTNLNPLSFLIGDP